MTMTVNDESVWDNLTCKDAVKYWDAKQTIPSVEMGGIGPSYEQCIQIGTIEVVRYWLDKLDKDISNWKRFSEVTEKQVLHKINDNLGGLSGAQAGAIMNLSFKYLTDGWSKTLHDNKDRMIMISKFWPKTNTYVEEVYK